MTSLTPTLQNKSATQIPVQKTQIELRKDTEQLLEKMASAVSCLDASSKELLTVYKIGNGIDFDSSLKNALNAFKSYIADCKQESERKYSKQQNAH